MSVVLEVKHDLLREAVGNVVRATSLLREARDQFDDAGEKPSSERQVLARALVLLQAFWDCSERRVAHETQAVRRRGRR